LSVGVLRQPGRRTVRRQCGLASDLSIVWRCLLRCMSTRPACVRSAVSHEVHPSMVSQEPADAKSHGSCLAVEHLRRAGTSAAAGRQSLVETSAVRAPPALRLCAIRLSPCRVCRAGEPPAACLAHCLRRGRASPQAEARRRSALWQGVSSATTRAASRRSRAHGHHRGSSTHCATWRDEDLTFRK
jgi:hypothetical protein